MGGNAVRRDPAWRSKLRERALRAEAAVIESLGTQSWSDAPRHIDAYNEMLRAAYGHGAARDINPMASLPKLPMTRVSPDDARARLQQTRQGFAALAQALVGGDCPRPKRADASSWAVERIQRLCDTFHGVAAKLGRTRHGRASARAVRDEYDVQRLMEALLSVDFDDVRAEECTPSYAGKCARMDFLIPAHRVVVETKMTRAGLDGKKLADELIVDIARYRHHPGCRVLYCFVYDPGKRIENARGLEADLETLADGPLLVKVAVRP